MVNGSTPQDYGKYNVTSAQLLCIPMFDPEAKNGSGVRFVEPTIEHTVTLPSVQINRKRTIVDLLNSVFVPATKLKAHSELVRPMLLPPISAIGVMDVGQGNCNMLIGRPGAGGTADVLAYYDTGYPLWFYRSSVPLTMRVGVPQYTGPIMDNQNGSLEVILSHWDWDHWRLGAIAPLNRLVWTIPNQPLGPAAANFLATIANVSMINAGTPPVIGPGNSIIYRCRPNPPNPNRPVPAAMIINNTGLALVVSTYLPSQAANFRDIVLTGDANFDSVDLPPLVLDNITGITAVHHGSNAHGAAQNLPIPPPNIAGYIAYSYGMTGGGNHAYGFPVAQAVAAYRDAHWTVQRSTAEGRNINNNNNDQAGRGNVRMGSNVALLANYHQTAFAVFPNLLD